MTSRGTKKREFEKFEVTVVSLFDLSGYPENKLNNRFSFSFPTCSTQTSHLLGLGPTSEVNRSQSMKLHQQTPARHHIAEHAETKCEPLPGLVSRARE